MSETTNPCKCKVGRAVPDDVRLLTTKEACETLGCGARTLWTWGALGLLKPVRVGTRFVRYRLSDIRSFLDVQQGGRT